MGFRGMGGYRGDLGGGLDYYTSDQGYDPSTDESAGIDFNPVTVSSDPTSSNVDYGIPDLGPLVQQAGLGSTLAPYLGGVGGALSPLLGGGVGGAIAGSAAAAGAATLGSPRVRKMLRQKLGRLISGRSSGRRMNPGNFHALRRSMRRLAAFERAAKKVYHFTHPKAGHSKFRFPRRKKR